MRLFPLGAAAAGAALVAGALGTVPAHAEAAHPATSGIYSVGGTPVAYDDAELEPGVITHSGNGYSSNPRPEIAVLADPDQVGDRVEVRDRDTGRVVCASDTPMADGQQRTFFSCTPDFGLPHSTSKLISVFIAADGAEESNPDRYVFVGTLIPRPTITLDGYDDATKTAHLSGTGAPGLPWSAYNDRVDPNDPVLTDPVSARGRVADDGTWRADLVGVERNQTIVVTVSSDDSTLSTSATLHLESNERLPAPTVSLDAAPAPGYLTGKVTTHSAGTSTIYDADGRVVAAVGGDTTKPSTSAFALLDTGRETHYTVVVENKGLKSDPVSFVVNEGTGGSRPKAPVIESAAVQPGAVALTVHGEPGAFLRVVDGEKVVGIKAIGASGTAQLTVAMPASRAANPLTATQTANGATSSASPIVLPEP